MGADLYRQHFEQAASDSDGYWLEQAGRIQWFRPPTVGHQPGELGGQCWFADGELNTEATPDVAVPVRGSDPLYVLYTSGTTLRGQAGANPDAGAFWRVISEHRVRAMFTAPTEFRAIGKEDLEGEWLKRYDLSNPARLFLAGEWGPPTHAWLKDKTGLPVIDHWWQTETGWAIACKPVGLTYFEEKPGSAARPTPGYQIDILDPRICLGGS